MTKDGETFFLKGIVYESIIENKKTPDTTGVGGRSGARTPDPLIKSQLLYQLS